MVLQNVSTKKLYEVSKEDYEKFFKKKLNWIVIDKNDKVENNQIIDNTMIKPKRKTNQNKK